MVSNAQFDEHFEVVVGLEIHLQLMTETKAYSADRNQYGNLPNTNTSAISLGHPGTLPAFNKKSLEHAVRLGIAVGSTITHTNQFARKNYFYADLPKGYQITQDTTPICRGGSVNIEVGGTKKEIGITRIHLEEDSGKSIHDLHPSLSLIDLNRAGVPLLEMVSEPELRSGDEAYAYISEVRKLVRYLDVCDGNMEEGSLRCDANISIRPKGSTEFGTRVEVKNLNSMRNVKRAIDFEFQRQCKAFMKGEKIEKVTLTFNADTGETAVLRTKEDADDYRYFPEPDLLPAIVTDQYIAEVKSNLPPLPAQLFSHYTTVLGLSDYDAHAIIDDRDTALYFNQMMAEQAPAKASSNWLMGEVRSYLNAAATTIDHFPVSAKKMAELISFIEGGSVSRTLASQQLFPLLLAQPTADIAEMAARHGLVTVADDHELNAWIEAAISKFPDKVAEYKSGKKGLLGLFMGEVMRLSGGKADPKRTSTLLTTQLNND